MTSTQEIDFSEVSVIIPFFNEELCVEPVISEILHLHPNIEIIAINDGSTDETLAKLSLFPTLKVISSDTNKGQGHSVYTGLVNATNEYCILMDGDGQFDPRDFASLISNLKSCDLVCGIRTRRQDSHMKKLCSVVANYIRRSILGDTIVDTGAMKVLRRTPALNVLFPFKGMHRYIPSMFNHKRLAIRQIPINHRPRRHGKSKYKHLERLISAIPDIIRVKRHLRTI